MVWRWRRQVCHRFLRAPQSHRMEGELKRVGSDRLSVVYVALVVVAVVVVVSWQAVLVKIRDTERALAASTGVIVVIEYLCAAVFVVGSSIVANKITL